MKKKLLLFSFMFVCLFSVLFVSSGAADWFGSNSISYNKFYFYFQSGTDSDNRYVAKSNSILGYDIGDGLVLGSFELVRDGSSFLIKDGSNTIESFSVYSGLNEYYFLSSSDTLIYSYRLVSGSDTVGLLPFGTYQFSSVGFVNSGFSSAIGFVGTIAGELLDNSSIIIAIGLSVGVTFVGWGISKVKFLIKGF